MTKKITRDPRDIEADIKKKVKIFANRIEMAIIELESDIQFDLTVLNLEDEKEFNCRIITIMGTCVLNVTEQKYGIKFPIREPGYYRRQRG